VALELGGFASLGNAGKSCKGLVGREPKMEAMCFSETLVDFKGTTRRYIPDDSTLYITAMKTSNPTN
jgi:hypothetical protein